MKTQKNVHEMMVALELHLPNEKFPGLNNLKWGLLRSLVLEEAQEFDDAMRALEVCHTRPEHWRKLATRWVKPDDKERVSAMSDDDFTLYWWAEALDAVIDSIVVLHNTSNAMGLDIEPLWDEVHRANMAKAGGPKRADGKALKPEGWKPPDIVGLLKQLLYNGGWNQRQSYELAIAYSDGTWQAEHFVVATSEEEAHAKLVKELYENEIEYQKVWTYCVQDLECSPGCKGLDIFDADFDPPDGWVHIERCDECDVFPHDQAAAESISSTVRFICVDCDPDNQTPMTDQEAKDHWHDRFRVIVPTSDALEAGLHKLPMLSDNQIQFCRDALAQGLDIDYEYSGRGMEGKTCPAVSLDAEQQLTTTADVYHDTMGRGHVVYARF